VQDIFKPSDYSDLLVGLSKPDDAAVWRLDDSRGLVVTTDFFTPVVDDAYDFGAIAATNSLSDIYAMGGSPFLALNIAALPPDLPTDLSAEILRGGAEKAREAGVVIAGGHTVQDKEPKYGLVVIGFVDPQKMLSKGGLQVGEALVLTKPLGFGVTTTALKREQADAKDVAEVVGWMTRLNKVAGQLALEFNLHGGTDVSGFGLLGHGLEMADAANVGMVIESKKIPFVSGAHKYAEMRSFAAGLFDNQAYFGSRVEFDESLAELEQMLLFDPQTSGGLFLGVPAEKLTGFMTRAAELNQPAWVIGSVQKGKGIRIK
jgi:selenide, water dikinase